MTTSLRICSIYSSFFQTVPTCICRYVPLLMDKKLNKQEPAGSCSSVSFFAETGVV